MPWFSEAGGTEPLAKRLMGLESVLVGCAGKSVLDLGGAEGLIAQRFLDRGSTRATVIDQGRSVWHGGGEMTLIGYDLNMACLELGEREIGRFDIVLALSVAQKLNDPAYFLRWAAARGDTLAVRTPGETFRRKGYADGPEFSVRAILADVATLIDEPRTFDGAWMGIFEANR